MQMRMKTQNGCRVRRSIPFGLQKRHVLTIRYEIRTRKVSQSSVSHQRSIGAPSPKWTVAAIVAAPAGIGMPTKYLRPGRPGFFGWGFLLMLNRANRLAPAMTKRNVTIA